MVVKKFEARSMKEALEMIKAEMGPESIIIAAKDNSRRFGLVGDGSVEITAAIQEDKLQKKNYAESKLSSESKERLHRGSAKIHKQLIEKVQNNKIAVQHQNEMQKSAVTPIKKPIERAVKYIDLKDDVEVEAAPNGVNEKLKTAAQKAWRVMHQQESHIKQNPQIDSLKTEIQQLRSLFQSMREMPQTFNSSHPGAEFGLRYELSDFFEKLINTGLSTEFTSQLLKEVQEQIPKGEEKNKSMIYALVARSIAQKTLVCSEDPKEKFEVFIGG